MTGSVALDVVIGLVFIYLLYSLLATVLSEIIATKVGLRARNLKEAIDRMLNDDLAKNDGFRARLWDSLKLIKNPSNPIVDKFYNDPEIKYLGSSGLFKNPSTFKSGSFSRVVINQILNDLPQTKDNFDTRLSEILRYANSKEADEIKKRVFNEETAKYIQSLWTQSYGDTIKFKLQLENWFDRTMEQCSEWYKRKIQIVLLIIGFLMAWLFNADTFVIIQKLSTDKDAREKIVSMANAYVQNNKTTIDTSKISSKAELKNYSEKLDSLLKIKKELEGDIASANTILGIGSWLPDKILVMEDKNTHEKSYTPLLDIGALSEKQKNMKKEISVDACDKLKYLFNLFFIHFYGYFVTAIAISLGAPFWFDLLNKLMKLRTSLKQEEGGTDPNNAGQDSLLNREA